MEQNKSAEGLDGEVVLKLLIDTLPDITKNWLHNTVQQLNDPDADGYIDHETSRKMCVDSGLVFEKGDGFIEVSADVNDLVYSRQYLLGM